MSWKKALSKLVPDPWRGYQERNRIKSKHIQNLNKLRNEEDVFVEFGQLDTYSLGHWTESKHSKTVERIRSVGTVQSDQSYHIPSEEDRREIKDLTENTVKWIRVRNLASFIFTILFIFFLIASFALLTAVLQGYLANLGL